MPLVIRYPPAVAAGRVVDKNVSTCDIFATLCELTGLEIPAGLDSRIIMLRRLPDGVGPGQRWQPDRVRNLKSLPWGETGESMVDKVKQNKEI